MWDVVVVGGGQAGLAAAFYLRRAGLDFVVLDAQAAPGGAWQHTWESFRLFSPSEFSSLPGWPMPPSGSRNPTGDHVIDYLTRYETRYSIPVERNVRVSEIRRTATGFDVLGAGRRWATRAVISATGTWSRPFMPILPGQVEFTGTQVHSAQYTGPDAFTGQRVAVVGGANSGAQIAADLAGTCDVLWCTLTPPRYLPAHLDGRDLFRLATSKVQGEPGATGVASLGDIVAVPPVRAARAAGLLDAQPMFTGFDGDALVWSARRATTSTPSRISTSAGTAPAHQIATRTSQRAQVGHPDQPDGPGEQAEGHRAAPDAHWARPDGHREKVDAVIWCTGFRPELSHLRGLGLPPRPTRRGTPVVPTVPGLFLLGYGDWCGPASATLIGVGQYARGLVQQVARSATART